jgi:hypothetical protein
MPANVAIFVFCALITWLLVRFRLREAASVADVRKVLPFFVALALFLLFNAWLAFVGRRSLVEAANAVPLTTLRALETIETGNGIILDGEVSAQNQATYWDYVAYIDEQHLYSPPDLLIRLADGDVAVSNDDYSARNWPAGTGSYPYLAAGHRVIVVGTLERAVYLTGPDKGQESLSVHAEIVYAGSRADFARQAERRVILPTLMLALNLSGALVILGLPAASWVALRL